MLKNLIVNFFVATMILAIMLMSYKVSANTSDNSGVTSSNKISSTTISAMESTETTRTTDLITTTETTETTETTNNSDSTSSEEKENSSEITELTQHAMGGKTYSNVKSSMRTLTKSNLNIVDSNLPRGDFIDVSSWNGTITVDMYQKMKTYGVTGVVVKLTEGTSYRNPYAKLQIANAKEAGLKVSVYHFSRYTTTQEAQKEAAYFCSFAKELGLSSDTVMVNDIEASESKSNATTLSLSFYNATKNNGYGTMIHYSSASWFSDGSLNITSLGGTTSVWIAHYLDNPSKDDLLYQSYAAWQWASDMTFPGVDAPITFDISIDYTNRFSLPSEINLMAYRAGDQVLFGDWDGDGVTTVAIKRGNTFYFKNSLSSGQPDITLSYGNASDQAIVGDWNGDGKDTVAVKRGNTYYFKNSLVGGSHDVALSYGNPTDISLIGDWNGDGKDTIAVKRGITYYFKNTLVGGTHDITFSYGNPTDITFTGDWDGDGKDTLLVQRSSIFYLKNSLSGGLADKNFILN